MANRPSEHEDPSLGAPVDYSFKKLKNLTELTNQRPRTQRVGRAVVRGHTNRFVTRSVWLNNNHLVSLNYLEKAIDSTLEQPTALGWLDCSFNNISEVDDDILKFPNLTIFYLHGNSIQTLSTLQKLKQLKILKTLTLHGNPIETIPHYRGYMINMLPQLVNLDFSPIVPIEKMTALPPGSAKKQPPPYTRTHAENR